jgi:hypothetical protein
MGRTLEAISGFSACSMARRIDDSGGKGNISCWRNQGCLARSRSHSIEVKHILERAIIHFACSASLVLGAYFLIGVLDAHFPSPWLPDALEFRLFLAGMAIFASSTLREPWDVTHGQSLVKAWTDIASWFLGCAVSVWLLCRFQHFL